MLRHSLAAFTLLAILVSANFAIAKSARPNIVFILADDMGYGDVQVLNENSKAPTPNLNKLAQQGMTFSDAHTPSSVCTPTRYTLLTGRYCWRSRLKRGVQNGYGPPLIETERSTVASLLKSKGYATGIVGKWHLGLGFTKTDNKFDFSKPLNHGPKQLGFDYSYVIPASLDFPPYIYIEDGECTEFPSLTQAAQPFPAFLRKGERSPDFVMEDCLDHLAEKASEYIHEQSKTDSPFLLYFPLTAPHKPVLPHPRFRGKSKLGPYGDFVMQVDWTVGQVLKALDDSKQADNTLVFYSSDNGSFMYRLKESETGHLTDEKVQGYVAKNHTANHVFRGTKADIWEAGHHVPFFARWPGKIEPGSKCDKPICLADFYATAAEIVGAKANKEAGPDSFSLAPLLAGKEWSSPRAPVIHHSSGGMFSIREGNWKLVLGNGSGGRQQPKGKPFEKPYFLFDLSKDITERTNVIDKFPEIASELEKKCLAIRDNGHSR
jgi:arylsulfatase A